MDPRHTKVALDTVEARRMYVYRPSFVERHRKVLAAMVGLVIGIPIGFFLDPLASPLLASVLCLVSMGVGYALGRYR